MSEWKKIKLSEIASVNELSVGKNFQFKSIEYIDTSSVTENVFDLPQVLNLKDAPSRAKRLVKSGDTIISTVRPIQKHFGFISDCKPNTVLSTGFAVVSPKKVDPRFLYYFLTQDETTQYLNTIAEGGTTTFPAFRADELNNLEILLPDSIDTQKAIAEILSSLDDKIELNNQINQNLEALAQALFKQWFVDFEFPNENGEPYKSSGGEMIDSELDEIPKGWSICMLSEVTEKITDGAHLSPKSEENGFPMASVKDMTTWDIDLTSCRKISEEDYLKLVQMGCRPKIGDVLIAKDGSFLKHTFVLNEEVDLVLLSSIAILRPNQKINSHILNLFLKEESVRERLQNIVTGAVIQRIVLKDFRSFKIPGLPLEIQEKFNNVVDGIYAKIWANNKEVKLLTSIRDTLLPKLISGELEVNESLLEPTF